MKKYITLFLLTLLLTSCENKIPDPEIGEGIRGEQFEVDANINEQTLDDYLFLDDVCYFDMRMLKDEANYEAISGDSYLSGFVKGFEVIPYPYLAPTLNLPSEVGIGYTGPSLFSIDENGNYQANYKESLNIIHDLFPLDKKIFLMCGGGGYAYMTKCLLLALGYSSKNIYNVGGYWYYNGKYKVDVKRVEGENTYYDFYKVCYHNLENFDNLTPIDE